MIKRSAVEPEDGTLIVQQTVRAADSLCLWIYRWGRVWCVRCCKLLQQEQGHEQEVKPEAAAPVRFNLQDNEKWLPLSGPCKSNWRRHYSAVIGSFVYKGGLSKLISQFRAKAGHTLDAWTMGLRLMCVMPSSWTSVASRQRVTWISQQSSVNHWVRQRSLWSTSTDCIVLLISDSHWIGINLIPNEERDLWWKESDWLQRRRSLWGIQKWNSLYKLFCRDSVYSDISHSLFSKNPNWCALYLETEQCYCLLKNLTAVKGQLKVFFVENRNNASRETGNNCVHLAALNRVLLPLFPARWYWQKILIAIHLNVEHYFFQHTKSQPRWSLFQLVTHWTCYQLLIGPTHIHNK